MDANVFTMAIWKSVQSTLVMGPAQQITWLMLGVRGSRNFSLTGTGSQARSWRRAAWHTRNMHVISCSYAMSTLIAFFVQRVLLRGPE